MKGEQLKTILADLNVTQSWAASLLNVQPVTVCRWATDARPIPTAAALVLRFLHGQRVSLDDAEAIRMLYEP